MKSNWEECTIGDVCTLGDGAHTKLKRLETGIKYLTSKNIKNGKLDLNKVDFISESDFEKKFSNSKSSVRNLQTGDVLFSIIGSLGNVYLYKDCDKFGISSSIAIFRPNDKINSKFLYYILSSEYFNKLIENVKGGSVQGYTNLPLLRSLSINIPTSIETQQKIAKILSCLDEKIELNNKINVNLEEQAQAIYKSWFVDFEPFGGVMPSDWVVGTLGDVIILYDSKRIPLSSKERSNMDKIYPYYGAASLMDYVDDYIFDGIYLLLGEDGSVINDKGYPILQYVWGQFWVNNHAHIMIGDKGFTVEILYTMLKTTNVSSMVTGAVQPKINQSNLKSIEIVIPTNIILSEFSKILDSFFDKIRDNTNETQTLTQLRNTLLPKLMSGEIDVDKVVV